MHCIKWIKKNWPYLFGLVLVAILLFSSKMVVEGMTNTCASRRTPGKCTNGYDSTGSICYWCGIKNGCMNPDDYDIDEFYAKCQSSKPDDNSKPITPSPLPAPPPGFNPRIDPNHIPCGPGTYSANGEEPCQLCSAGTYAPYDFNMTCTKCPNGYTSKSGATSCSLIS